MPSPLSRGHHPPCDEERIKAIRANAAVLVAYGACATWRINCRRTFSTRTRCGSMCMATRPLVRHLPGAAVSAVVKVDAVIPAVRWTRKRWWRPSRPYSWQGARLPEHPVCVECKLAENVCVFEKGLTCLGPVTWPAAVPYAQHSATSALAAAAWWQSQRQCPQTDLQEHGLTVDQMLNSFRMFDGYSRCKMTAAQSTTAKDLNINIHYLTRVEAMPTSWSTPRMRRRGSQARDHRAPRFFEAMVWGKSYYDIARSPVASADLRGGTHWPACALRRTPGNRASEQTFCCAS